MNEDDVEGRWMKNGVEIKFQVEPRFTYTTIKRLHRLAISETFRSDAGEYTFLAGRNQSSMNLLVRCKAKYLLMFPFMKKKNPVSVCHVPHICPKRTNSFGLACSFQMLIQIIISVGNLFTEKKRKFQNINKSQQTEFRIRITTTLTG